MTSMDEHASAGTDTEIRVVHSSDREGWTALVDPPGAIPSRGSEHELFSSAAGPFTTGFWEREPDTWTFERPYDEVALILSGVADIETQDGQMLRVEAGDVLVTPKGSKGAWHIRETLVKFYAIYGAG
jgi:uncharacterized cupin superfamily protein